MVELWVGSCEKRCVRRRSQGHLSIGAREDRGLACQPIQIWRKTSVGPKEAHTIGTGGIQSNQDYVRMRGNSRFRRDTVRCLGQSHKQEQRQNSLHRPHVEALVYIRRAGAHFLVLTANSDMAYASPNFREYVTGFI